MLSIAGGRGERLVRASWLTGEDCGQVEEMKVVGT